MFVLNPPPSRKTQVFRRDIKEGTLKLSQPTAISIQTEKNNGIKHQERRGEEQSTTHLSIENEVSLGAILARDHAVPPVDPSYHCSLEFHGSHHLHGHDGLQDAHGGVFHGWGKNGIKNAAPKESLV